MKYIKSYKIFESDHSNENIYLMLNNLKIRNYTINADGTVDVDGDVDLRHKNVNGILLVKLPLKFGKVTGDFDCSYNDLITLEGSPVEVGGNFWCDANDLNNLIGGPEEVGGVFSCSNNALKSLEGAPAEVGGDFICKKTNLQKLDCATNVRGNFICTGNNYLNMNVDFYGHVDGKIIYE